MGEDILRITLERNPRSLPALSLLAMMMQDAGRNEEAAKLYRQVLELDPKRRGRSEQPRVDPLRRGEPARSSTRRPWHWPRRVSRSSPITWTFSTRAGMRTTAWGTLRRRRPTSTKCIELYPANSPSSATPHFHLALAYAAMKRKAEAVGQLRKALDLNRATVARTAKEQADAGRVTSAIKAAQGCLAVARPDGAAPDGPGAGRRCRPVGPGIGGSQGPAGAVAERDLRAAVDFRATTRGPLQRCRRSATERTNRTPSSCAPPGGVGTPGWRLFFARSTERIRRANRAGPRGSLSPTDGLRQSPMPSHQ